MQHSVLYTSGHVEIIQNTGHNCSKVILSKNFSSQKEISKLLFEYKENPVEIIVRFDDIDWPEVEECLQEFNYELWLTGEYKVVLRNGTDILDIQEIYSSSNIKSPIYVRFAHKQGKYYTRQGIWCGDSAYHPRITSPRDLMLLNTSEKPHEI